MSISFVFCVGTFLTAFLSGCNAPDNCGCGCIDPPPQVEDTRTIIPDSSWECRQASPSEKKGDELFTETVGLAADNYIKVGKSKNGNRNIALITGGTVTGEIAGKVLFGGGDYQLMKSGSANLDARYTIETNGGELIIVRNCGRGMTPVPTFETSVDGSYSYMNDGLWLSSAPRPSSGQVEITIFESIK